MQTKTKIAIGLGLLAAVMLFQARGAIGKAVRVLGQAFDANGNHTPWGSKQLGNGDSNIGKGGCILTSLTMAANSFKGTNLTPDRANDLIKQAGGFLSGSLMVINKGAQALGLNMSGKVTGPNLRKFIDDTLALGGLVLLRVDNDHDLGLTGDHTILLHSRNASGYIAADPALARDITMDGNLRGSETSRSGKKITYQAVEAAALFNT